MLGSWRFIMGHCAILHRGSRTLVFYGGRPFICWRILGVIGGLYRNLDSLSCQSGIPTIFWSICSYYASPLIRTCLFCPVFFIRFCHVIWRPFGVCVFSIWDCRVTFFCPMLVEIVILVLPMDCHFFQHVRM